MDNLVIQYYTTDSPTERILIREVVEDAIDIQGDIREDLAQRTIEALAQRLKGKGRRK